MLVALLFLLEVWAKAMAICDSDWANFNGSCFKVNTGVSKKYTLY
jgi:hypothetical protein